MNLRHNIHHCHPMLWTPLVWCLHTIQETHIWWNDWNMLQGKANNGGFEWGLPKKHWISAVAKDYITALSLSHHRVAVIRLPCGCCLLLCVPICVIECSYETDLLSQFYRKMIELPMLPFRYGWCELLSIWLWKIAAYDICRPLKAVAQ